MIDHADIDQCQCLLQLPRDALIGVAGFDATAGVIVGQDDSGAASPQAFFHDFARMYGGATDRPTEHFGGIDQLMAIVQEQHGKRLVVATCIESL